MCRFDGSGVTISCGNDSFNNLLGEFASFSIHLLVNQLQGATIEERDFGGSPMSLNEICRKERESFFGRTSSTNLHGSLVALLQHQLTQCGFAQLGLYKFMWSVISSAFL